MGSEQPGAPAGLPEDPARLAAVAAGLLDGAADYFREHLGAPRQVIKRGDDFATAVDLELERRIGGGLAERTGIPVHGEEFGGPQLDSGTVWLLDPLDGTRNYSAGLPLAGMLVALVHNGQPVLGLTWLPLAGQRMVGGAGVPATWNGEPLPQLPRRRLRECVVALGSLNVDGRGRYPGRYRLAVLAELSRRTSRLRMHGCTGADLAFAASGALGGAMVFGGQPWDNAAGVALTRAVGGVVTDLEGDPWRIHSPSVLAAAPGVHGEIMDVLDGLGAPAGYGGGQQGGMRVTNQDDGAE